MTDIVKEIDNNWREAQPLIQQWWYEANLDQKMLMGQQDGWNRLFGVNYRNQRLLQFNKLLRIRNMISGYQRKHRHVMVSTPVENADMKTSDQFTGLLYHIANNDGTYEKVSDCFEDAITTGFVLQQVWLDSRKDPVNPDIKTAVIPYSSYMMDPYFREQDLSDCMWIQTRRYLTKDQLIALAPDMRDKINKIPIPRNNQSDGRFLYMPENRQMYNADYYAYDEYWKRTSKLSEMFLDRNTGEVIQIPFYMDDQAKGIFLRLHPSVEIIKSYVPSVRLHVLVNSQEIWQEDEPQGIDDMPFIGYFCYHYPEAEDYSYRYQGVIRSARDAQIEFNRRRNKFFDILDSQINSGVIVKEDALVDPQDAFLAGQGRSLFLKSTATLNDIKVIPPPQIPNSMFELAQSLEQDMMSIVGATEELFGEDDGSRSGFMIQLRQGAGLVSLQNIFDRLRASQKRLGNVLIKLIQANWTIGKVKRIINEEPTEQFRDRSFQKYDCVVEEGLLTSTQRQLQFIQLLQMREMGIPVPTNLLIETSTLQKKDELIKAVMAEEQKAKQMADAQQIQELLYQKLLTRSVEAKAQNDFAAAEERQGRTISNLGLYSERESEKAKNMAAASLDQVKAIAELRDMDDARLLKLADFVLQLQQIQQQNSAVADIQDKSKADQISADVNMAKQKTEVNQTPQPGAPQNDLAQQNLL